MVFAEVVPDHSAVIALTNAISEQGYYVKRVIENPPQVGAHANRVNRYWDIAGRRYRGVYPIDFHLIVTGEEVYDGDIRAHGGTTQTTLTVQGAFANPTMEAQVEGVWEQLHDLIAETCDSARGGPGVAEHWKCAHCDRSRRPFPDSDEEVVSRSSATIAASPCAIGTGS